LGKFDQASPEHLKPILICAYETGMRSGEIFGIAWSQVDLERGFIFLKPEQTKTNQGRKVPISPRLHQTLLQIRQGDGPVFRYHGKSINSVKRSFKRACKKAGISDFHLHDFRHTFVTNMRKAGNNDRVIMAITGHRSMSAYARYDTIDEDDLKKVVGGEKPEIPATILAHRRRGSLPLVR
jgi:integrase